MAARSKRINEDDLKATRLASLAALFMTSPGPHATNTLLDACYAEIENRDSALKALRRDLPDLAKIGIVVEEGPRKGRQKTWVANTEASFARGAELNARDAIALSIACQPVLDAPGFPLADELKFALAKIDRAFGSTSVPYRPEQRSAGPEAAAIKRAVDECLALDVIYADAQGNETDRTVEPYGAFSLRGRGYLVGRISRGRGEGEVRTLRLDRIRSIRIDESARFEAPRGFSIEDWKVLPFQIGPATCNALIFVPEDEVSALEVARMGKGRLEAYDGGRLWRVEISDVEACARWSAAHGLRPRAPESLVGAWHSILEEAADAR